PDQNASLLSSHRARRSIEPNSAVATSYKQGRSGKSDWILNRFAATQATNGSTAPLRPPGPLHKNFVIPERRAAANPESIFQWPVVWIPGSRPSAAPRNDGSSVQARRTREDAE